MGQLDQEILARRWELNERCGNQFLSDATAQRDLRFSWEQGTIVDELSEPAFTYPYPSTIGTSLFFHGMFEPGEIAFTSALLAQLDAPLILDVGANIGHHALAWCLASEKAVCHAFEPVSSNAQLLRRNAELAGLAERVSVDPRAVDRKSGKAILREAGDAAYSTLDPDMPVTSVAEYEIPTVSIDDYVRERGIARVDLLKIDVEGAEASVLAGAERTLERDAPFLLVEISAVRGAPAAVDVLRALVERGYHAYAITNGVVTEYEGVFDDTARNYVFLPARRTIAIPTTHAPAARAEAAAATRIIRRLQASIERFALELKEKDAEIVRLKSAADERLQLINASSAKSLQEQAELLALHEQLRSSEYLQSIVHEKEKEIGIQSSAAAERLYLIEEFQTQVALLFSERNAAQAELGMRELEVRRLNDEIQVKQEEVELQSVAAVERLRLIEELSAHSALLRQERDMALGERERFLAHITLQEKTIAMLADEVEPAVS